MGDPALHIRTAHDGALIPWAKEPLSLTLPVVQRPRTWVRVPVDQEPPPAPTDFPVLPRRWVVERTFAWLGRYRRLSKEYARLAATEEAWILLVMPQLMTRRLTQYPLFRHRLNSTYLLPGHPPVLWGTLDAEGVV